MKKSLFLLALAIVASASLTPAAAGKKKDKKKQEHCAEACCQPVQLLSSSDSASYAAGQAMTEGLIPYLTQRLNVDTAYMADFVKGFRETIDKADDPAAKARIAGMQIADQVLSGIFPQAAADFSETPDSITKQLFVRGFTDILLNDTTVMTQQKAQELFNTKREAAKTLKIEKATAAGRQFLAENALKEGVITTPSGLQYKVLTQGTGDVPQKTDKVKVHYEGRLIDGTVFDASTKHGTEPATFRADQVIKGWTEALTMMPVGSKWELYIPQNLAYGERQAGQIPPYSTLIFQVELLGIEK